MNMSLEQARQILKTDTQDLIELRRVYIRMAKESHPDVAAKGGDYMASVNNAYQLLKTYIESLPCPICKGTGEIVQQVGFKSFKRPCSCTLTTNN